MEPKMVEYMRTADPDQIFKKTESEYIPRGHYKWLQYEEWLSGGNEPDDYEPLTFPRAVT